MVEEGGWRGEIETFRKDGAFRCGEGWLFGGVGCGCVHIERVDWLWCKHGRGGRDGLAGLSLFLFGGVGRFVWSLTRLYTCRIVMSS